MLYGEQWEAHDSQSCLFIPSFGAYAPCPLRMGTQGRVAQTEALPAQVLRVRRHEVTEVLGGTYVQGPGRPRTVHGVQMGPRRDATPWESGAPSRGSCRHRFPRQAGDEAAGLNHRQLSFQDASPDPRTGRSEQEGGRNGLPWPLPSSENDCFVATGKSPTLASCWPQGASACGEARGTNPPTKVSRNPGQPGGTCRKPPRPNRAPGTPHL